VIKASLDTTLLLLLQHTPWRCFFFTLSVVALGKSKTSPQNLEFLLLNTEWAGAAVALALLRSRLNAVAPCFLLPLLLRAIPFRRLSHVLAPVLTLRVHTLASRKAGEIWRFHERKAIQFLEEEEEEDDDGTQLWRKTCRETETEIARCATICAEEIFTLDIGDELGNAP
jgi:hypothetical protein